jgi:hypothetical protein
MCVCIYMYIVIITSMRVNRWTQSWEGLGIEENKTVEKQDNKKKWKEKDCNEEKEKVYILMRLVWKWYNKI